MSAASPTTLEKDECTVTFHKSIGYGANVSSLLGRIGTALTEAAVAGAFETMLSSLIRNTVKAQLPDLSGTIWINRFNVGSQTQFALQYTAIGGQTSIGMGDILTGILWVDSDFSGFRGKDPHAVVAIGIVRDMFEKMGWTVRNRR